MAEHREEIRIAAGTVAKASLVVLAFWGLASFLWMGREVLFVALLAILVGVFLSFWTEKLVALKVPRAAAATLVLLVSLGVIAGLFTLLWPPLQDQLSTIRNQLPAALDRVAGWLDGVLQSVRGEVGVPMPEIEAQVRQRLGQEAAGVVSGALPLLNTVVGAVTGLIIVIIAGLFAAVEPRLYRSGFERLFPPRARPRIATALERLAHTLRWWMVGTAVSMLLIGTLTTLGLWLIDMPAPLALGVIAGLLQFIPMFGPILSAVPAVAVALIISPAKVVWVVALYAGIQFVESNLITPLVMKEAVELPPALTLLFQSLMAVIFGFLGLLLAVPVLAAGMVLVQTLYVEPLEERSETRTRATA